MAVSDHDFPIGSQGAFHTVAVQEIETDIFQKIAEQKIREAQERGDFDDLPGKGKPLDLEDWERVPEELRLAYKVLKNAGFTPPELTIKKEIAQIEDLLATATDEQQKYLQIKKLNYLITKLSLMRPGLVRLDQDPTYVGKIVDRITVHPKPSK
jgi:hypothetical protein